MIKRRLSNRKTFELDFLGLGLGSPRINDYYPILNMALLMSVKRFRHELQSQLTMTRL